MDERRTGPVRRGLAAGLLLAAAILGVGVWLGATYLGNRDAPPPEADATRVRSGTYRIVNIEEVSARIRVHGEAETQEAIRQLGARARPESVAVGREATERMVAQVAKQMEDLELVIREDGSFTLGSREGGVGGRWTSAGGRMRLEFSDFGEAGPPPPGVSTVVISGHWVDGVLVLVDTKENPAQIVHPGAGELRMQLTGR